MAGEAVALNNEGQGGAPAPETSAPSPGLTSVSGGEGSSAQPTAGGSAPQGLPPGADPTKPPPAAGSVPDDPRVPWARFREVQTQYSQMRRAAAEAQEKYEKQIQDYGRQLEELKGYRDDFTTLERLLEAHPEIAEQLYQRAGQTPLTRGAAAPTGAVPPEVAAALKDVQELKALIQGERQQQMLRQQAEQDRQVSTQLDTDLRRMLAEVGYDEGWLPHARGYVLERVRAMPTLDIQDVPYLFAEWRKPMQGLIHKQMEAWRGGKQQDQNLPASPSTTAPVTQRPNMGAMDRSTSEAAIELLRSRGWTDGG